MKFRRLGPDRRCGGSAGCPDIFELDDGDFAIIGLDITDEAVPLLPASAGCAANERVIRLSRKILVQARDDIPETT